MTFDDTRPFESAVPDEAASTTSPDTDEIAASDGASEETASEDSEVGEFVSASWKALRASPDTPGLLTRRLPR